MTQSAVLAASGSAGTTQGFKNRIINGNMTIDQRNAGASVTGISGKVYPVDRFPLYCNVASKCTAQQSTDVPAGFTNSILVTSSSAYTIGAGEFVAITQDVEGYNLADLNWGTANGKAATLSFWVKSSLTGTFGGSIGSGLTAYAYPFTYTISSANTWTYITVAITAPTTGSADFSTTNGSACVVRFGLGVGSTFSGAAGSWSNNNYFSATGATSLVGTNGATWRVTGVQLEVGTTATNFDFRSYGTELQLCQRYFAKLQNDGSGGDTALALGMQTSTTNSSFTVNFPVTMRAEPTVSGSNIAISDFIAFTNAFTPTSINAGYNTAAVNGTNTASGAQYRPVFLSIINNTAGYLALSAEL